MYVLAVFVNYILFQVLMKLINAVHLYFSRECTLEFSMRTSLYHDRAIDSLLIEHRRSKREKDKKTDKISSKEMLTSTL